jgi:hypothetical protein
MTGYKDDGDPAWLSDGPEYDSLRARSKEMQADKEFAVWLEKLATDHLGPDIKPEPERWYGYYKARMTPANAWAAFLR